MRLEECSARLSQRIRWDVRALPAYWLLFGLGIILVLLVAGLSIFISIRHGDTRDGVVLASSAQALLTALLSLAPGSVFYTVFRKLARIQSLEMLKETADKAEPGSDDAKEVEAVVWGLIKGQL